MSNHLHVSSVGAARVQSHALCRWQFHYMQHVLMYLSMLHPRVGEGEGRVDGLPKVN